MAEELIANYVPAADDWVLHCLKGVLFPFAGAATLRSSPATLRPLTFLPSLPVSSVRGWHGLGVCLCLGLLLSYVFLWILLISFVFLLFEPSLSFLYFF